MTPQSLARPSASGPRPGEWIRRVACLLMACSTLALFLSALPAFAQKKAKGDPQPVTDTLIKVTAFSEMGATLRGARVRLLPADREGQPVKGKTLEGTTNGMGEYPFHVPKTEAVYVLRVEAKGFVTTDKVVTARGEDQLDVFLQLPAKK